MGEVISLRMDSSLLGEIDKVAEEEGKTRSAVIKEAVRYYLQHVRRKENMESFVPFAEYKKVNEELVKALGRIKELEVEIANLRKENEALKKEASKKRRWFF